jgi:hypothetical protein
MSKLAIFLTGILLGCFMTLYHVRSETIRELDLEDRKRVMITTKTGVRARTSPGWRYKSEKSN